jgi:sulfur carrier protein ThiS
MMNVQVVLHSYLREKLPPQAKGRAVVELAEGATAAELFERLGLPEHVAWAVNGVIQRDRSRILSDGDEVRVFRQGAGG